jgi:hypothetical protein
MTRRCDFLVFDSDNHLYETRYAFTRHLPDRYTGAIDYVDVRGRTKIVVRGTISEYIPNPTFDVVARPGGQEEYFRNGNPEGKSYREIVGDPIHCLPGFREPKPRLELMDELGVDQTLMFPTLASLLEERMRDDPELTHVMLGVPDALKDHLVSSIVFPKRMGRPEEFALLVESIARNPYLNGDNIRLDGALRFPPK